MEGISMQHFSGVDYSDLSYLTIPYFDFNGSVQQGHMIVNKKLADEVLLRNYTRLSILLKKWN